MIPSGLKPGHVLLYRGVDALGDAIDFFEPHGQFCHAALVYDATRLVRQNPGGPAFENLADAPWINIMVKRLDLTKFRGSDYDPHSDPAWLAIFPARVLAHMKDVYDYAGIAAAAQEGILEDVGLGGLVAFLKHFPDPVSALSQHMEYCSAFDRIILEETTKIALNLSDFSLDSREAALQETPQDLSTEPLLSNL